MANALKNLFKECVFAIYRFFSFFYVRVKNIIDYKKRELLKSKFKFIGYNSNIPVQAIISNPQFIAIGSDFSSLYNLRLEAISEYKGFKYIPSIVIGNNVSFNSDCHLGAIDKISIGDNVLVGSRVLITDHYHGAINKSTINIIPLLRELDSKGPVIIEDNVWIGEGVCILPGVTIGKNAIIGANAVVNKNVAANTVVGGIPAVLIKDLN